MNNFLEGATVWFPNIVQSLKLYIFKTEAKGRSGDQMDQVCKIVIVSVSAAEAQWCILTQHWPIDFYLSFTISQHIWKFLGGKLISFVFMTITSAMDHGLIIISGIKSVTEICVCIFVGFLFVLCLALLQIFLSWPTKPVHNHNHRALEKGLKET